MEEQTLAALRRIQGVVAAYVVDGPEVVESLGAGAVAETQGALLAALLAALRQATGDLNLGALSEVILEAERGAVMAATLAGGRLVVVLTENSATLGIIRLELRRLRRAA